MSSVGLCGVGMSRFMTTIIHQRKVSFSNVSHVLSSIQKAYDPVNGRYNDVEFTLADGSKLGANKFLLASQSKYFDAMFYGSLKHEGRSVDLKWCSSTTMRKILDFLSCGEVDIGDLEMKELFELLEASRLMCLNLYHDLEPHVKKFVETALFKNRKRRFGHIDNIMQELYMVTTPGPVKLLLAFDYALQKRFVKFSEIILKYIYKKSEMQINLRRNLSTKFPWLEGWECGREVLATENEFNCLSPEEAGVLSNQGMTVVLSYGEGSSERILLLPFFAAWKKARLDSDIDISQFIKLEELKSKELKFARDSELFPKNKIIENLERIARENANEALRTSLGQEGPEISPLQGTKVVIDNLQSLVTKEEIVQLFGDIGPLKSVKLISAVYAEVTFVNKTDALKSVETYHNTTALWSKSPLKCQLLDSSNVVVRGGRDRRGPGGVTIKLPATLTPKRPEDRTGLVPDMKTIRRALFVKKKPGARTTRFTITMPKISKRERFLLNL